MNDLTFISRDDKEEEKSSPKSPLEMIDHKFIYFLGYK